MNLILTFGAGIGVGVLGFLYVASPYFNSGPDGLGGFLPSLFFLMIIVASLVGLVLSIIARYYVPSLLKYVFIIPVGGVMLTLAYGFWWMGYVTDSYIQDSNDDTQAWADSSKVVVVDVPELSVSFDYVNLSNSSKQSDGEGNIVFSKISHKIESDEVSIVEEDFFDGEIVGKLKKLDNSSENSSADFLEAHVLSTTGEICSARLLENKQNLFLNLKELEYVYYLHADTSDQLAECTDSYISDSGSDVFFVVSDQLEYVLLITAGGYQAPLSTHDLKILEEDGWTDVHKNRWYTSLSILE